MILRPLLVARVAHATPAGAIAVIGMGGISDSNGVRGTMVALAGLLVLAAGYVVARSFRMRVRIGDGKLEVRGWLWSRTIAASAVTEVTDFPAIRWRDARDRRRWTPIIPLMSSGRQFDFIARHNDEQVRQLRRWVKRHRC